MVVLAANPDLSAADALKKDLAAEKLGCPVGSELLGQPPPLGKEVYCARVFNGTRPVRHGPYVSYFRTGQKKLSGNYHHGKKDGLFTQYYASGEEKEKAHYRDGVLEGERIKYFPNRQLAEKEFYKAGKLHGRKETYDFEGKPKYDGHYVEGKPEGPLVAWYPNGQQKYSGFIKDGKKNGTWTNFFMNGEKRSTTQYRDGKLHGASVIYRRDGTVKQETHYESGRVLRNYGGQLPRREQRSTSLNGLAGLQDRDAERYKAWEKTSRRRIAEQRKEHSYRPRDPRELARWENARLVEQRALDRQQNSRQRRAKMAADAESSRLTGLFDVSGRTRRR